MQEKIPILHCQPVSQVVAVHCASSGRWVRDLPVGAAAPTSVLPSTTGVLVAGSADVVAAVLTDGLAAVVWSRRGFRQVCSFAPGGGGAELAVSGTRVVTRTRRIIKVVDKVVETWGLVWEMNVTGYPLCGVDTSGHWTVAGGPWQGPGWGLLGQVSVWRDGAPLPPVPLPAPPPSYRAVTGLHLVPPYVIVSSNICTRTEEPGMLLVLDLEGQGEVRRLASGGRSEGLVTSPTMVGHWVGLDGFTTTALEVYDKAGLVDAGVEEGGVLLRVVELEPDTSRPPALCTTGLVWAHGRTLMVVDFWVQREKCEEQVERERKEEERRKREAEEEARLVELKKSRPSYFSEG